MLAEIHPSIRRDAFRTELNRIPMTHSPIFTPRVCFICRIGSSGYPHINAKKAVNSTGSPEPSPNNHRGVIENDSAW